MKKRIGFVGIIVENRQINAQAVNEILTEYGELIRSRMGVNAEDDYATIALTIKANSDELGQFTGKLGNLPGVSVKSMFAKGGAK